MIIVFSHWSIWAPCNSNYPLPSSFQFYCVLNKTFPWACHHHFTIDGWVLNIFLTGRCQMFPFHILVLFFWSIMVDPCLIHNDTSQRSVCHLQHNSSSICLGRLSKGCACAILWVDLEPILHKLSETQVCFGSASWSVFISDTCVTILEHFIHL